MAEHIDASRLLPPLDFYQDYVRLSLHTAQPPDRESRYSALPLPQWVSSGETITFASFGRLDLELPDDDEVDIDPAGE